MPTKGSGATRPRSSARVAEAEAALKLNQTDLTKAVIGQLYWNDRPAAETVREYAAFEYSPVVAGDVAQVIATLEQNHHMRWWPGKLEGVPLEMNWFPSKGAKPQADPGAAALGGRHVEFPTQRGRAFAHAEEAEVGTVGVGAPPAGGCPSSKPARSSRNRSSTTGSPGWPCGCPAPGAPATRRSTCRPLPSPCAPPPARRRTASRRG